MSISLLIFIGSLAYLLSFATVHMLPDKEQTKIGQDNIRGIISPEHHKILGEIFLKKVNLASLLIGLFLLIFLGFFMSMDLIAAIILSFLSMTFMRKVFLDWRYKLINNLK